MSTFTLPIKEAETPEDKLAEFRAVVRLKAGYVQSILYGLIPHFVEGKKTMGVTPGLVHYIDPVWIMQFDQFEGAFLYMHEISHILRDTAGRRGDRLADHRGLADRGGRRGGRDEQPWIAELRRISPF